VAGAVIAHSDIPVMVVPEGSSAAYVVNPTPQQAASRR
jgi:hypothetical protein